MNISEQLNLLQDIKENIKTKLLETGAIINDLTPFSEYSKYIFKSVKSTIFERIIANNQPLNIKEETSRTNTDIVTCEKYSV